MASQILQHNGRKEIGGGGGGRGRFFFQKDNCYFASLSPPSPSTLLVCIPYLSSQPFCVLARMRQQSRRLRRRQHVPRRRRRRRRRRPWSPSWETSSIGKNVHLSKVGKERVVSSSFSFFFAPGTFLPSFPPLVTFPSILRILSSSQGFPTSPWMGGWLVEDNERGINLNGEKKEVER